MGLPSVSSCADCDFDNYAYCQRAVIWSHAGVGLLVMLSRSRASNFILSCNNTNARDKKKAKCPYTSLDFHNLNHPPKKTFNSLPRGCISIHVPERYPRLWASRASKVSASTLQSPTTVNIRSSHGAPPNRKPNNPKADVEVRAINPRPLHQSPTPLISDKHIGNVSCQGGYAREGVVTKIIALLTVAQKTHKSQKRSKNPAVLSKGVDSMLV